MKAEISSGGVTVDVDVADVDSRFTGHPSLRYKTEIPESVLTALPCRHLEFDVPAEYVLRAVGVPYHP